MDRIINWTLFSFSIVIGLVPLLVSYLKQKKKKETFVFKDNIPLLIASFFLIVGCMTRICFLDVLPGGLNQDEASCGYDAYAIMKYGIDRNGMSYPIHLIAWGSGQNALYAYFCIPFIKLFSNTEIALRLPMALSGCLSLFVAF